MRARPERIRFTFFDDPSRGVPLELRSQRHWFAGLVFLIFFVIFASVAAGVILKMGSHRTRDVFDLMALLFEVFWLLGWSVGVFILGAITMLFLFYRESARLEGSRLVHVPRLGPLKAICEYDLAKMSNLRLEDAKDGLQTALRFDYGGRTGRIGDAMEREDAERLLAKLKSALPMRAREARVEKVEEVEERRPRLAPLPEGERPGRRWLSPSSLALLAANLLPLAGVLVFGWDISQVMVLYWAESAVIGFYTALKIAVVGKLAALAAVPFFIGHFGGFMAGHFMFVYALFIRAEGSPPTDFGAFEQLGEIFEPLWPMLAALAVSHGVSFVVNFLRGREYAGETISTLMTAPYKRVVVMHLTIIFGGWIVMLAGTQEPVLALLVLLKTAVDLRAHRKEHAAVGRAVPAAAG